MQSVLIINSEIYDKYQRYAYFFNWFEDHSNVSICIWNKFASDKADIDELVPQLFDVVKNVTEWNAYIVDEPFVSGEHIERDFKTLTQYSINPYERANHSKEYDPTEDPLMRLMYFLGGRGVEELEYINNYAFRATRPTQMYLLTPRIFENLDMQKIFLQSEIEEKNRKLVTDPSALLTETDTVSIQYSEFWDRYEYPPNCRFLVFDIPDVGSVRYEDSWFLVWLATMTLILNTYSSAELGPYKLHRLNIDVSAKDFELFLNKYYAALRNACDISEKEIENEIKAIKAAMEDTSCNHPVECAPVYVNFPDTDFSKFFPKNNLFGLTKDNPKLDTEVWEKHKADSGTETHRLFKAVTRGKNEAVDAMNRTFMVDLPLLKNQHLTRYDAEDIVDDLNKSEIDMLGLKTDKTASRVVFEEQEKTAAKEIEKTLPGRVLTDTYKKLLIAGIAICSMGFIPFIISSAKFNATSFLISLLITAFSGAIVGGASFIALKIQRMRFDEKLNDYTDVVSSNIQAVKDNAQIQSKYLTHLLNYMEKYQMLKSGKIEEHHMKHLEELTRIHSTYEEASAQCQSIAGLCSVTLNTDEMDDLGEMALFVRGKKIYLHDDTDSMLIPLNTTPDRLVPPFSFVQTLYIAEETVYESSEYYNAQNNYCGDCEKGLDTSKGALE